MRVIRRIRLVDFLRRRDSFLLRETGRVNPRVILPCQAMPLVTRRFWLIPQLGHPRLDHPGLFHITYLWIPPRHRDFLVSRPCIVPLAIITFPSTTLTLGPRSQFKDIRPINKETLIHLTDFLHHHTCSLLDPFLVLKVHILQMSLASCPRHQFLVPPRSSLPISKTKGPALTILKSFNKVSEHACADSAKRTDDLSIRLP